MGALLLTLLVTAPLQGTPREGGEHGMVLGRHHR
nr:MAG TPA: hypothetical protein [Caudoviricetes sp.]